MRLLIFILLFPFVANSQVIMTARYTAKVVAGASCSYLLDSYSGASAAYSLRKLSSTYSGYAIKVRRSSDNTEQDIGFTNCDLDTSSLKTFVGANDGYISKWYDQTGNTRDATQSTSANQPSIVLSGVVQRQGTNNMPSINWGGGSVTLTGPSFTFTQPTTHFMVAKNDGSGDRYFIDGFNASRQFFGPNAGQLAIYAGVGYYYGTSSTAYNVYTILFNGASSSAAINAGSAVTGNAGTQSMSTGFKIGNGASGGMTGYIAELILYGSDNTSNGAGIRSNINTYYGIY